MGMPARKKSSEDFEPSERLLEIHEDGRRPLRAPDGTIYCAYSFDNQPPKCPFGHRGPKEERLVNGVRQTICMCHDGRLRGLPDTDYEEVDIKERKK